MADIVTAIHREASPTSMGAISITTTDLGGITPKAVIAIASNADTDQTNENGLAACIGVATGASNQFCCAASSENGVGTTNTDSRTEADELVHLIVNGTDTIIGTFVEFVTNGVSINFTTVEGSDPGFITYYFFGGTDLSAHANIVDLGTGTSALDQTAPGFEPDLVFAYTNGIPEGTTTADAKMSMGCCANDGTPTQYALFWESPNGVTTTIPAAQYSNDSIAGRIDDEATTWEITCGSFDSSGFSLTPSANTSNADLIYLALNLGGAGFILRDTDPANSSGNKATTGFGFQPQFVMYVISETSLGSTNSTVSNGPFNICAFTEEGAEFSNCWFEDDGLVLGTTNCGSYTDNIAFTLMRDNGNTTGQATFVTIDSDGYTLNVTDTTGLQTFEVGIEVGAASAETNKVYLVRRFI